jgi:hypothetical protein
MQSAYEDVRGPTTYVHTIAFTFPCTTWLASLPRYAGSLTRTGVGDVSRRWQRRACAVHFGNDCGSDAEFQRLGRVAFMDSRGACA